MDAEDGSIDPHPHSEVMTASTLAVIVRLVEEITPETEQRAIRLFNEPIEQDDLAKGCR
jgi:hypothetical protein